MKKITDKEMQKIHLGTYNELYNILGAKYKKNKTTFRVYAPNAHKISVIGDFNNWDENNAVMYKLNDCIWEVIVDGDLINSPYRYRIFKDDYNFHDKFDPFGIATELRPHNSNIIAKFPTKTKNKVHIDNSRLNIYELHLGGFKASCTNYQDIGKAVLDHVIKMNYTHVEIMPIMEYPQDCSWGYQALGYYSVTSRYGSINDFKKMVDIFHTGGIGVILDWVPVHFAIDEYGLCNYDFTPLFEYKTQMDAVNELWGTYNFDLGSGFVRSFLLSNLNFYHNYLDIDGFRYDAVANILNWNGGVYENELGISFLKSINHEIKMHNPNILLIAEDSSTFPNVTKPTFENGLGFDYKWNLGWMHDTLDFFSLPFDKRSSNFSKLTFSFVYMDNEKFILPFSHDEVVHIKGSIANKMYGDYGQKMQQLRLLYTHMFMHPGEKLNFMGNDLATFEEFSEAKELDWGILNYPIHDSFNKFFSDLSYIFKKHSVLSQNSNFEFLHEHVDDQVLAYKRNNCYEEMIIILNTSPQDYENYDINVSGNGTYKVIMNSNFDLYSGYIKTAYETLKANDNNMLTINLAAFSAIILTSEILYDTNGKTVKQLKQYLGQKNIKNISSLKKSELIELIEVENAKI